MEVCPMYNSFTSNVFGNDDDIFDDSKTLSDSQTSELTDKRISNKNFNQAAQSVLDILNKLMNDEANIEEVRTLITHLHQEHGIDIQNFLGRFRVQIAGTIIDGAGSWISDYKTYIIPRSVMYALDSLCENKFALLDKYFNLELENAKRIIVSRFLQDFFLSNMSEKVEAMTKVFAGGFDSRFIKTYFEVLHEINEFTIFQNNGVYVALANELDLPCNQDILDGNEILLDSLTPEVYAERKFNAALQSGLKDTIGESVALYTEKYLDYVNKKNN